MSKKTRYLFGILLTIGIGTILMRSYCCTTGEEIPEKVATVPPSPPINTGFTIRDLSLNTTFEYTSDANFRFKASKFNLHYPIPEGVTNGIQLVKAHLGNNIKKSINITVFYTANEANTSAFPNVGIARANSIKNYLSAQGIPSRQINIFGKENNNLAITDSLYMDPVRYTITEGNSQEAKQLGALKKRINDNPLVLYFENGQASINPTVEQRQKIADISLYLDKVEDATITVEGHTDNSGDRITNIRLGLKRANAIKQDLILNGIPEEKIITTSKGPDVPIASNTNEEGKAKNRRSVVKINEPKN